MSTAAYVKAKYRLFRCQNMTFCEKETFLPAFGRVNGISQALQKPLRLGHSHASMAAALALHGFAGRRLSPAVGVRGRRTEIPAFAGMTFGWSQGDSSPPFIKILYYFHRAGRKTQVHLWRGSSSLFLCRKHIFRQNVIL